MSNGGSGSSGAQAKGETYTGATRLRWTLRLAVTGISISGGSTVESGSTLSLSASISPAGAYYNDIIWLSSDTAVATVNSNGVVTGTDPGTVTIKATCGVVSGSKTVTVTKDKYSLLMETLSRNELYYLYSPQTKLVQSDIPLNIRLIWLSVFRQHVGSTDTTQLKNDLALALGVPVNIPDWYLEMMQAEYELGAKGLFTPEMQTVMIQSHLETLRIFASIVLFDVSSKLTPFDANGNIRYSPTQVEIQQDFAHAMTNNPSSNKVMLGSSFGDTPYNIAAQQMNMSYFYSPQYEQLKAKYGSNFMKGINKQFLAQQKALNKEIWFSHNPTTAYPGSSFEMEVNWIKENYNISSFSAQNLQQVGEYWKLVP